MFTYEIYLKDNNSNPRYSLARKELNCEGQDGYVISINGRPSIVQFEFNFPHPQNTVELSAQAHIAALEAEQQATV